MQHIFASLRREQYASPAAMRPWWWNNPNSRTLCISTFSPPKKETLLGLALQHDHGRPRRFYFAACECGFGRYHHHVVREVSTGRDIRLTPGFVASNGADWCSRECRPRDRIGICCSHIQKYKNVLQVINNQGPIVFCARFQASHMSLL